MYSMDATIIQVQGFSALQRAEIAEILCLPFFYPSFTIVSVLFNEPKLLKSTGTVTATTCYGCFSALQRAEIAEINPDLCTHFICERFSALQRAEIAEIIRCAAHSLDRARFSALQRAEIAEIVVTHHEHPALAGVSVLFNEPKLLKFSRPVPGAPDAPVSVLFNEPKLLKFEAPSLKLVKTARFQCSSTSRNC